MDIVYFYDSFEAFFYFVDEEIEIRGFGETAGSGVFVLSVALVFSGDCL